MGLTPNTAEVIDAPPPHEAYANAPDLRREMHRVLALGAERAWLLRRVALMARMALHDPGPGPGPVGAAAQTAGQRVLHDRRHPERVALERRNGGRRLAFGWWSCLRANVSPVPRTRTRPRSGDATSSCPRPSRRCWTPNRGCAAC
ncbi:hypothetical protein OG568_48845 (plasmid) [Streptomyces sp. NBC_01450]|uniref:hypothetical protein n=1 Tax=Streptomyces sp. NBC_01450 TaxID=2903871 RepID=UPI002E309725|nr:hypothetical protein [Streptomyces sp. NBC_01450]